MPDGTLVSPFLNPLDRLSGLPAQLIEGFSLAAGILEPRVKSKIHLMPWVTQVTFVRRGTLQVRMKAEQNPAPYALQLSRDQAVLTEPGTFFQLINETDEACEVLYLVSPAYIFEQVTGQNLYDDAVVLAEDWETLERNHWQPAAELPTLQQRQESLRRLAAEAQPKLHFRKGE